MKDLKEKTIRGGLAKACSQVANFLLRLGSLMVLARLLEPKEFGLVGMVTAVIGIFNVFKDFGLSAATVQHRAITEEQSSTLFWVNMFVGAALSLTCVSIAPLVAKFYHEPRLLAVTAALATGFIFNAAGVQHVALLERQMRFTALSLIDIASLVVSSVVSIEMAVHHYGHWSLVAATLLTPAVYTLCTWFVTAWLPGKPHRQAGVLSIVRFGGTVTLNGFIMYVASNFEKVLLGRFWGVDAVGIYGRAYQLVNIPTDNLNSSAGGVAFAALSRLQDDPVRFRSYFLKGYSLVLSLTVPITCACALFANDMILIFLGPKWDTAAPVFRLLAPSALVFAMLNPLGWLLTSLGLVRRSLKISLVLAPTMIAGYLIGLRYGPKGVALCYSVVLTLWLVPLAIWAIHGTVVSKTDMFRTASKPLVSCGIAAGISLGLKLFYGPFVSTFPRFVLELSTLFGLYLFLLLHVMGQKQFYLDVLRGLTNRSPAEEEISVPA